jgi:hypothetical protein
MFGDPENIGHFFDNFSSEELRDIDKELRRLAQEAAKYQDIMGEEGMSNGAAPKAPGAGFAKSKIKI